MFFGVCANKAFLSFSSLGKLRFESLHDFSHTDELFPESKQAVGLRKILDKHESVRDGFLDCVRLGGVLLPSQEELGMFLSPRFSVLFLSSFWFCY